MSLNRAELLKLARQAKERAEWIIVRDWASQIYGEGKAAKIDIETYGEYNDEGGTNYYIESIAATDKEGKELDPDYSLPFFQTETWKRYDDEYGGFIEKIKDLCLSKDERTIFVDFNDLPSKDADYDLTTPPPVLTLPTGGIA